MLKIKTIQKLGMLKSIGSFSDEVFEGFLKGAKGANNIKYIGKGIDLIDNKIDDAPKSIFITSSFSLISFL